MLNNFKDSSNSTNDFNDSINKYQVYVYYRLGGSPETQSKPFRTLENAVACARYIYNNRGNVRIDEVWVCPKGSSGEKIFKINKDGTVSYRDDASVIVKNEFEKPVQQFDSNQVTDDKIKIPPIKSRYDWKNTSILYEDYYSDADSEITTPEGKIKMHFRIADSTANEGGFAIVNMEELGKSNSSLRSALYPEAKKRGGQRAGEQLGYRPNDHAYYFGNGKNAYEYVEKILDEYYPETAISENATEINLEDIAEKVHDNHNARKVRMFSFSHTGNGNTAIINLVDDRNLTEPHKLLQQFGELIGVKVKFFNNYNKNFHGAYEGNTIYLNVNSARSLTSTFAHEIFHFLKESNPKLFEEIAKAAGITQEQLTNYLAETQRTDVKETADVTEEMIADAMQEILNRVARKDKSLVERFFAWLKDTLQKFKDIFQNPKGKLTRAQYARMADTFGKMAVKLNDADGNKIFRYNTRTHNLELANGESLDALLKDTENEIYSSEEQGFFNWGTLSLDGAKLSATGNIDNADKKVDNTRNSDNKINDYLTITADGDFDVKLLNERPAVGKETERERIERRKKEIDNMDKLLDVKVNPDAYAQLLTDRTIDALKKYAEQIGSWDKAEKGLRLKYNSFLANYSKSNPEKKVISYLLNLKGAIRYAGQRKSDARGDRVDYNGGTGQSVRGIGKILDEETKAKGTRTGTGTNEINQRHSDNQGVFYLDGGRKNSIGNSGNTATLNNAKFSIGSSGNTNTSNDNSSEGFFQKVKNLLTGRPNQQNERIRKQINRLLSNLTGVKISAGHMNNGLDIVVKDVEKVIRTNRAYDWQNLLPAVGQKIATILKINSTPEMGNYIADWLMTGALNNTSAEAKNFEKALRDNPEIRENLLEIQSVFTKWRNMTPMEKAQATIEYEKPKPTLKERAKNLKQEGYQQFFEELSPVQDLVKEWETLVGRKLPDAVNPYSLLRNYRGIAGRAKLFIEGGESTITAIKQMFPNINWDGFKTMKMILSDIGALDDKTIYKDFAAFAEAKHVKDIHLKNKENLTAQRKVQDRIAELEEMKDNATDGKQIKRYDELIKKNQDKLESLKKSFYDTPMTEEVCDAIIRDYSAKYGDAQKELVKFSKMMLAILKNSGVISEQAYFNMLRDWKNYVPLHRVFDDNEDIKFGDSLKKMKGSSRDTVDPIQTIIRNTYDYIRRAEKNEAKLMLASMARTGGVGMLVEEVDGKTPDDKTTIMFYENGVKKYLQTDVAVVRAVNNMTPPSMSWFTKFLRIGTMLLRNFATVYNPSFAARNLIRDPQDAFIYSKYGFFSPMDFVRGFIHAVKQDDVYAEWMAAGGAQASFWSVDRDYTEASINNLTKRGLKKYTSVNGFLDLFSRLGEWSELGTRIGYFEKVKNARAKANGGKIDRSDLVSAALESRDLMDFARGGKAGRSWNNAVAFANANLQGWDKFFRTYDVRKAWSKDAEERKEWQRAMIRLALGSVLPAVLCFMLCGDEDWYKNDLQDYEKQNYWILGENLRIPKGLDLGIRFFSNLTENFLNSAYNKDPKAFNSWAKPLKDSAPDFIPTGLAPIIECLHNYDEFRQRPIVPQYQQKLPAAAQYSPTTSSFAKFIGEMANISPRKVEHFLFGYTGNMGREFLRAGESVTGLRDYNFRGISDIPLLGGFFRIPYQNPKVVKDFYETLDEQTAWRNEYTATKKKPAEYDEALYNRLHKAQKELSEIGKLERKLMLDPNLSGDKKQERQLLLQKKRVAIAERAMR